MPLGWKFRMDEVDRVRPRERISIVEGSSAFFGKLLEE